MGDLLNTIPAVISGNAEPNIRILTNTLIYEYVDLLTTSHATSTVAVKQAMSYANDVLLSTS